MKLKANYLIYKTSGRIRNWSNNSQKVSLQKEIDNIYGNFCEINLNYDLSDVGIDNARGEYSSPSVAEMDLRRGNSGLD